MKAASRCMRASMCSRSMASTATFAAPADLPTGALRLTLRLSIDGNSVDERALAKA